MIDEPILSPYNSSMSTKAATTEKVNNSMGKLRLLTAVMVIVALLISCAPFILPQTAGSKSEGFLRIAIIGLGLSSFAIVAAILFALGLKDFKDEFKKTYYYLCAGLVAQAAGVILYPIALYLGL